MKFIADHHFVFVTHKQEGDNSSLVRDLNELKSLKARQEDERNALVARQTALAGKLSAATRSQEQRTTAIANATTELNNATAALAVAKLAANATAATIEEKNLAAERATNYVNHLTERVAAVQGEINKATEARDKATRLQGQLGNLTAKLAEADQRVADAKLALKQAQQTLSDAESDVQHLTDILAIDKALVVYQDNQGLVSAVTRQTPTVEVRPTFDLNGELNGYKVTQTQDSLGATTTTAPIAEELPTFDLDGELNSYKVIHNADGIGATPITTPAVDELPTFDLNAYKTSQKHAGARPNDTSSQTLPMFSRKDATKQELPNTGSYSRVERQIALGGYTILGLILGFTIQRKRER